MNTHRLVALEIKGYRPFGSFTARLGSLEVIVGANRSGRPSLFEFLRFLRDAAHRELPPEIVAGTLGQEVLHRPGTIMLEVLLQLPTGTTNLKDAVIGRMGLVGPNSRGGFPADRRLQSRRWSS